MMWRISGQKHFTGRKVFYEIQLVEHAVRRPVCYRFSRCFRQMYSRLQVQQQHLFEEEEGIMYGPGIAD